MDSLNSLQDLGISNFFDRINKITYNGKLKFIFKIESIDCKEWEKEKKIFEKNRLLFDDLEFFSNCNKATRCYVGLKESDINNSCTHEGHFDLRPDKKSLCDAYLPIPESDSFYVTCKRPYKSDDFNNQSILTVPYTMSCSSFSHCATSSLWIILNTLSHDIGASYISLSEISLSLADKKGNSSIAINDFYYLLRNLNYSFYYYFGKKRETEFLNLKEKLKENQYCRDCSLSYIIKAVLSADSKNKQLMKSENLYAYIESEIPVYLVFESNDLDTLPAYLTGDLEKKSNEDNPFHTVVAIGHTLEGDSSRPNFIVHDVSYAPFITIPSGFIDQNLVEALVVLPENVVHYDFIHKLFLRNLTSIASMNAQLRDFFKIPNLEVRPFLVRSQRIKFWFSDMKRIPVIISDVFSIAEFPNNVWVQEFSTNELKAVNKALGYFIYSAYKESPPLLMLVTPEFCTMHNKGTSNYVPQWQERSYDTLPLYRSSENVN